MYDKMTAQPHASSGATVQTFALINAFGDLLGVLYAFLHASDGARPCLRHEVRMFGCNPCTNDPIKKHDA